MKTILYIHGFNSTGTGMKSEAIRSHYRNCRVLTPTFNYKDFPATLKLLNNTIMTGKVDVVAGTSLGGFLALYGASKFKKKCLVINPTLEPSQTLLRFVGENRNFVTKERYILTEADLKPYAEFEKKEFSKVLSGKQPLADADTRFLLSEDDELLGNHHDLESKIPSCHHFQYFPGMNHQFTATRPIFEAIDELIELI